MTIVVTDDGPPPLSARRSFQITVTGPDPTPIFLSGDSGMTEEGFRIGFTTAVGWYYRVERSDDFQTWSPLGAVLAGTGQTRFVLDPVPLPSLHRSYRVRVVQ